MEHEMRIAFALVASLTAFGFSTPSSAQVISVSQALTECPDLALAQACPSVATEFLDGRAPGTPRNGEIVNLVVAIAEAAQQDSVPRRVCLNAAEGLRVLANGVTDDADEASQINDIADALCLRNRTAAIGTPGGVGLIDSSGGGGDVGGGGPAGGPGVDTDDDGDDGDNDDGDNDDGDNDDGDNDDGDDDGGTDDGQGGLGSNDAANSPNEHALDHANEHALDNTHGKNGE
jgi:hypothetical protein